MAKKKLKKSVKTTIIILILGAIFVLACNYLEYYYLSNRNLTGVEEEKEYYTSGDFGLVDITSTKDFNYNNNDDYLDMLEGAIEKAKQVTIYESGYYADGYPPDNEGVSSDIVWAALQGAGYNLKDMMSKDIRNTYKDNIYGIEDVDDNIDFRRINNIEIFLQRYGTELTTNINNIKEFNVGDIVIFDYGDHIGIVSNKRNNKGIPYIIQITGQEEYEVNLEDIDKELTSHYRFDYSDKLKDLVS